MLLAPVSQSLSNKRLLIVGDGALSYLPFSALPKPERRDPQLAREGKRLHRKSAPRSASVPMPLIIENEVMSLPSLSTLAALRIETLGRRKAARTLAVVADPVFDRNDNRVRAASGDKGRAPVGERATSVTVSSEGPDQARYAQTEKSDEAKTIARLPFTRREADEILALVPAAERMAALDFEASKQTVTDPKLGNYRYLHFATHGILNSSHPELSGIVFSLVNRDGDEQDGFLWAHEVYNLRLPAEMVVLSGCRTGLGKEIRGEGLVGLTRGFMYAGAARVLVSLWDVSDEASAELMARFYRRVLSDEGRPPSSALRAAQIEVWKEKRWQAPYYWAAFVLQGETR